MLYETDDLTYEDYASLSYNNLYTLTVVPLTVALHLSFQAQSVFNMLPLRDQNVYINCL